MITRQFGEIRRPRQCRTPLLLTSILCIAAPTLFSRSIAFAEQPPCAVTDDILVWKAPTSEQPNPPEKTVAPIPPPLANPAVPANVANPPFSLAGKFLSNVDDERRYCTAQFVEGTDVLLTAAHCVRNKDGVWLSKFEFAPVGSSKTTISDARCIGTKSDWVTGKSGAWYYPADYAFIILKAPSSSAYLKLDFASQANFATTIGFPLNIDGGAQLYQASGAFARETWPDGVKTGEDFGSITHGEPRFGLGISGGAWITDLKPGQLDTGNKVVGLNGSGSDGFTFGAVMDVCAVNLLQFVRSNCPP
jgi:hypothetical protein